MYMPPPAPARLGVCPRRKVCFLLRDGSGGDIKTGKDRIE